MPFFIPVERNYCLECLCPLDAVHQKHGGIKTGCTSTGSRDRSGTVQKISKYGLPVPCLVGARVNVNLLQQCG